MLREKRREEKRREERKRSKSGINSIT